MLLQLNFIIVSYVKKKKKKKKKINYDGMILFNSFLTILIKIIIIYRTLTTVLTV